MSLTGTFSGDFRLGYEDAVEGNARPTTWTYDPNAGDTVVAYDGRTGVYEVEATTSGYEAGFASGQGDVERAEQRRVNAAMWARFQRNRALGAP